MITVLGRVADPKSISVSARTLPKNLRPKLLQALRRAVVNLHLSGVGDVKRRRRAKEPITLNLGIGETNGEVAEAVPIEVRPDECSSSAPSLAIQGRQGPGCGCVKTVCRATDEEDDALVKVVMRGVEVRLVVR